MTYQLRLPNLKVQLMLHLVMKFKPGKSYFRSNTAQSVQFICDWWIDNSPRDIRIMLKLFRFMSNYSKDFSRAHLLADCRAMLELSVYLKMDIYKCARIKWTTFQTYANLVSLSQLNEISEHFWHNSQ